MKTLLSILLIATITLCNSSAQQDYKIPIKLMISGETGLEDQVRSYFNRELRAIGDVEVTDDKDGKESLMEISIVVMEPTNKAGVSIGGYIISIAVTDRSSVVYLALAGISMTTDEGKRKQLLQFVPKNGILVNHILQVLDSSQLPETCRSLVAQIDGSNIENNRKQRREWDTSMKNQKK